MIFEINLNDEIQRSTSISYMHNVVEEMLKNYNGNIVIPNFASPYFYTFSFTLDDKYNKETADLICNNIKDFLKLHFNEVDIRILKTSINYDSLLSIFDIANSDDFKSGKLDACRIEWDNMRVSHNMDFFKEGELEPTTPRVGLWKPTLEELQAKDWFLVNRDDNILKRRI